MIAATVPLALLTGCSETLKWDAAKGHWGVTFNMRQPDTRESTLNDIQAGAYYKITPALRVGGAFAFGSEQVAPGPKPAGHCGLSMTRPVGQMHMSLITG